MSTYDPKQNVMIFAHLTLDGFSDGTMISAKHLNPQTSSKVGGKGDVVVIISSDGRGEVEANLMQSAPMNAQLSAFYALGRNTGKILFPLMIRNLNESTVLSATSAWIIGPADSDFGVESGERKWRFGCKNLKMFVGGALDFV